MRSFARDLGISQSYLSQVLNQKRNLSDDIGLRIAKNLKLNLVNRRLFIKLVRLNQVTNIESRNILNNEINEILRKKPEFSLLSEKIFNVVADWYYFAILELSSLESFALGPQWISKTLRISLTQSIKAINLLKELGLLKTINGRLQKVEKNYLFSNVSSTAIKKHHHDTLDLAHRALVEQSMDQREFFTVCFPMDPKLIAIAKDRIREFSESLMTELQDSKPKSVYKLSVQFFRLDHGDK